ncbi:MAG: hypothetical protein OEM49_02235 [Myxococcales bacterium]|nr:hypothetical protein [Myxococcales bacterium]MDH5306776.1 hypothetical protein [Myxococcales bacterium]MDH5566965.1 hypothetical protein [Myxococcales bacterium]
MSSGEVGLPEALERAARALPADAEAIRPANGDPLALQRALEGPAALRVLSWLLQHEPAAGEELAAAWVEQGGQAASLLQQLDVAALAKPARKIVRRVLHQLRSRGVSLAAPPRSQIVAKLPPVDDPMDAALLTPIDPVGARGVYLAVKHPAGGARLFELLIDEARGVLEFDVYSAGRSKIRKFLRDAERRERFAAVAAPPDSVRALIARAAAGQPADRPLPRGFSEWRSRLTESLEDPRTPGERVREALEAPTLDAPENLARAASLLAEGTLGPWPPPEAALREVAETLAEVGRGVVVISDAQRREQLERALAAAAESVYTGGFAALTARRFEESAYVYWKSGAIDDARACLAAARAFEKAPASANPVARAALERMLAPLLTSLVQNRQGAEGRAPLASGS